MTAPHVIEFLSTVASRADLLDHLKLRSKQEVLAAAEAHGCPFSEAEFDRLIWNLEIRLAARRGEEFDAQFPLWQTMWGQHYLEYLVLDLLPSLTQSDLDAVLEAGAVTT